jgi:hypothetical protein
MVMCACGEPVFYQSAGKCKRCYHRDYMAKNAWKYKKEPKPRKPLTIGECTYSAAHLRLMQRRGSASAHTCECGNQAEQWALNEQRSTTLQRGKRTVYGSNGKADKIVNGVWSGNPDDYDALCIYCHMERDRGPGMDPAERRRKQAEWVRAWEARQPADYKQRKNAERLASITQTCTCGKRVHYVKTGECATCYARRRYIARKAGLWNPAGQRMPHW